MTYHPLTDKIWALDIGRFTQTEIDAKVRAWLEAKVLEIEAIDWLHFHASKIKTLPKLREIMGLEPKTLPTLDELQGCLKGKDTPKEQEVKAWCEHCAEGIDNKGQSFRSTKWHAEKIEQTWNFCPICGIERPEPKRLRLWERLRSENNSHSEWEQQDISEERAKLLANTILQYFREVVDETFMLKHSYDVKVSRFYDELKARLEQENS